MSTSIPQIIITTSIVLVASLVFYLALRELNCWYWKINERNRLLKHQNVLLGKIYSQLKKNAAGVQSVRDERIEALNHEIRSRMHGEENSTDSERYL